MSDLRVSLRVGATLEQSFDRSIRGAIGKTRGIRERLGKTLGTAFRVKVGATQDPSVNRVVGATRAGLSDIDRAAERTRVKLDRIARAGDALERARTRLAERRAGLTDAVIGGTALLAPVAGAVGKAIELESVVADIGKVVGLTDAESRKMGASILELSTRMPVAAAGLGEIMVAAAQAGTAKEELRDFAANAGMVAVAFDMSGRDAGERMTALRDIFKLGMGEVMNAAGAFNHLSNNMAATAPALLDVVQRAAPMARSFGLTAEHTGALGATMLALKTPPEVAGTAISAMLARLSTAPQQTGKFQDALDELGISAEEFDEHMRRDAQGALLSFFETVAQSDNKKGILFDMFGLENMDDVLRFVDNLDMYRAAIVYATDKTAAAGSIQEEYDARIKTTGSAMQLLRNQFGAMGATVGTALLEPLKDVTGVLGTVVNAGASVAERFPGATRAVVGTLSAVAGLSVATAAGGYAASFLQVGFAKARLAAVRFVPGAAMADAALGRFTVGGVGSAIRGLGMLRLAMIGTGVGALVVALGVGAAMVMKHWEPIKAFFGGFVAGVGTALAPIAEVFKPLAPAFKWVGDVIGWIGAAIGRLFAPIETTNAQLERVGETGRIVGELVGSVFRVALTPITGLIGLVGKALKWLGLLDESEVEATITAAQASAVGTAAPRARPGRNLVGATLTAGALSGAPALAAPPAFPAIAPAAPAAITPVVFPVIETVDAGAEASRVRAELEDALRDVSGAQTTAPAGAGADPAQAGGTAVQGVRAGQPEALPVGGLVFHQTFNFHGFGPEAQEEIRRIVEGIMRRAAVDAGQAADDGAFLS